MKAFSFDGKLSAVADPRMHTETAKKLFRGFCLTAGELAFSAGAENTFVVGSVSLPVLPEGKEYAFTVTEEGIALVGCDFGGLMRGFCALLMKIEYDGEGFAIPEMTEISRYRTKNRMIHICVFPDNDRYFTKKMIRLAGVCQYTHVILEFWGTLQYDCMKELSWPGAYTKEEAKDLIREIRELGMEPIPMFNQLGHASACRVRHGKHVVLEQNPLLQHLFTPDGWDWNIRSEKVFQLHRAIRAELYELFGDGEYMHVGCDEAYNYTHGKEERKTLPEFLSRLTATVAEEGRRPMVWMDMFLERDKYENATATCQPDEVETMCRSLHPRTVMVDWQYRICEAPVATALDLQKTGYDVMGAPWHNAANYNAFVDTVCDHGLFGVMMTTWHTMEERMPAILGCALRMGVITFPWSPVSSAKTPTRETAALLRRVSFEGNDFASSGWTKIDMYDHVVGN